LSEKGQDRQKMHLRGLVITATLWHFVILCRIYNTLIWLENVKINKNWWLQRRFVTSCFTICIILSSKM